jgi:mannitol/fructose-specific phosphotransferase system IIA component (Ntr-type)
MTVLDTRLSQQKTGTLFERSEDEISIKEIPHKQGLQFAKLLPESRICFWNAPLNKMDAVKALVIQAMSGIPGIRMDTIFDAVNKREEQGSTFLNEGVAFPHARIAGLNNPVLAMGVARQGITDLNSNFAPYFVFLILSPADMNSQHVRILSGLSRLSMDSFVMPRLKSAQNPAQISELFKEWDTLSSSKDNNF